MTIARREFLVGGLALGALATAEFLRPRKVLDLLGPADLEAIVPEKIGTWASVVDANLIQPVREGSLVDTLYDGLITRRYVDDASGAQIMLLIAYGRNQTDALQLHRPEVCYPALGLPIVARQFATLSAGGKELPAVELVAEAPNRTEDILYWTRMGESFPQTASTQRSEKLKLAFKGIIPDGTLVRISQIRDGQDADFAQLESFGKALIDSMKPQDRKVLIGSVA